MTTHFLFFLIDCVSWFCIGAVIGQGIFPDKRISKFSKKLPFVSFSAFLMFLCGIFVTATEGLPDSGYAYKESIIGTIFLSSIFLLMPRIRKNIQRKLNFYDQQNSVEKFISSMS